MKKKLLALVDNYWFLLYNTGVIRNKWFADVTQNYPNNLNW